MKNPMGVHELSDVYIQLPYSLFFKDQNRNFVNSILCEQVAVTLAISYQLLPVKYDYVLCFQYELVDVAFQTWHSRS